MFATPTGVGTILETGGFIIKHGENEILMKPRQTYIDENNKKFLLEKSIFADVALIKAKIGDKYGNLIFNKTARNFNWDMGTAAKFVIAEVEELVEVGALNPDHIHLPGLYIHAIVKSEFKDKPIEKLTNN